MPTTLKQSGFSAVEAVVSLAILSVAMVGLLTAMSSATKVSKEELNETDMQAEMRRLTENVCQDLDGVSICYMQPWWNDEISPPTPPKGIGAPIATADTDSTNNCWLLMRYQIIVAGVDPNNPLDPNSTVLDPHKDYGNPTLVVPPPPPGVTTPPAPVIPYGAVAPATNTVVNGACYSLVFKQDPVLKFIQEADPAAAPPTPVPGTRYIYRDLDGDGAYTTKFIVGHIQRRFSPVFDWTNPSSTGANDPLEKEYPGTILVEWDAATNSPKNSIFHWAENPGAAAGYNDNCFHYYTNQSPPVLIKPYDPSDPSTANNWHGANPNVKAYQWDPILKIRFGFLVQPDDGRLGDSGVRLKIAATSVFIRGQRKTQDQ